jgi:hypothetical protein
MCGVGLLQSADIYLMGEYRYAMGVLTLLNSTIDVLQMIHYRLLMRMLESISSKM